MMHMLIALLLTVGNTNYGPDRLFIAPDGDELIHNAEAPHTRVFMAAGSTREFTIWLEDDAEADINFYQVMMRWTATPLKSAAGVVEYVDLPEADPANSIMLDVDRDDFIFLDHDMGFPWFLENESEIFEESGFGMTINVSNLNVGATVDGVRSLGQFKLQASPDASGMHELHIARLGEEPWGGTAVGCPGGVATRRE
jgi:hypothetical protein